MASFRSGLFNAHPDVLNEISYFISGNEIVLLWMTGCRRLLYSMSELGGVKRLVLSADKHLDSWPLIIPCFKRLEELSLNFGYTTVVGGSMRDACQFWPKSIRKLYLSMRQAESCWKTFKIAECFPNLEDLTLSGWTAFLGSYVSQMPNLTRLRLNQNTTSSIDLIVQKLPPCLKHLELPSNPHVSSASLEILPRELRTLDISSCRLTSSEFELIGAMPMLTSLTISLNDSGIRLTEILTKLPRMLRELNVKDGGEADMNLLDLPPLLETLTVKAYDSQLHGVVFSQLPRTITSLSLSGASIEVCEASDFPPNLKHLDLASATFTLKNSFFALLPRGLVTLELGGRAIKNEVNDNCVPFLPPNLITLNAPSLNISGYAFAQLPRTLYYIGLGSEVVHDEHIGDLPPFVLSLVLSKVTLLTDACARLMPRGIRSLSISSGVAFTFACVPHLPPFIDNIDMGQTGVAEKYQNDRARRAKTKLANARFIPDPLTPEQKKLLDTL